MTTVHEPRGGEPLSHEPLSSPRTPASIGGVGHSMRRKEDDRFIRGAGRYLDDVVLPGMLHLAILRSPLAHARIASIDTSAAAALEGVVAVVTGEMLAGHGLAWMPTLSGDTQAVLATDKVRYQGQEVAGVVATDPYLARDALNLIEVEYEDLPVITTPQQAIEPGAVLIRDEKEGQTDNIAYTWEAGDRAVTDAAFARAAHVVRLATHYPRSHPAKELGDYDGWRARQRAQSSGGVRHDGSPGDGRLLGIGLTSFTEVVGAGNSREFDIAGIKMFDSAELRVHPPARQSSSSGSRPRARGTRRRSRRSSPRSSGSRPSTSRCRRATPTTRPTASGRTRPGRRRSRESCRRAFEADPSAFPLTA